MQWDKVSDTRSGDVGRQWKMMGQRECRCNERQNEAGESGTKVKKKEREERGKGRKRGRRRIVTRNARTTLPRSWGQLTVHATTITTIDFDGPHHPSPPSLPLLPSLFFFSFLLVWRFRNTRCAPRQCSVQFELGIFFWKRWSIVQTGKHVQRASVWLWSTISWLPFRENFFLCIRFFNLLLRFYHSVSVSFRL